MQNYTFYGAKLQKLFDFLHFFVIISQILYTFALMITLNIIFSACLATMTPEAEDSIRTERVKEVIVTSIGARQRIQNVQMGEESIQIEELTNTPQLFGEKDIIRSIQLLPGVKSESDASSSFQVRGGTSAQNQVLFDNAPIYNVGHAGGLFSTFNDDALAGATLYKGLLPAQYGGATSAVLDIVGRTGDKQKFHGGATIGILSAKGTLEGPIAKDKASFLVTARRTYMDLFLKLSPDFRHNTLYFYDVNAKLDWTMSKRNQLFLTFFTGYDRTAVDKMVDIRWSNLMGSLKWLHHFNGGSNSQTTLYYSTYENDNGVDFVGMNLWYKGHIRQGSFRQDFNINIGNQNLRIGFQSSLLNVKSAEWQVVNKYDKEERRAWENAAWLNGDFRFSKALSISAGVRLNMFSPLGGSLYYDIDPNGNIDWYYNYKKWEIVTTHRVIEPRGSISIQPTEQTSIKLGYARTSQNIHALRNQSTSTPFDRYAISSNIFKPEVADQWSAGFFMMSADQKYDFSLEGYYRTIDNVLDYRDGKSFSSEIELERLILAGEGKSYGAEFCLRKNLGKLTGWIAYTLSWSRTRIDGVNNGEWYDANNDRRHDVNIVASLKLGKYWALNGTWVFNSGQAFTAPSSKYQVIDNWIYYYAERNGYRAPDYHRLDISASWTKKGRRVTNQWVFGIYNLYNRYNPYLITFEDSDNGARTRAEQISLFGIVPSISYNFKF